MGYETKLFVGTTTDWEKTKPNWFNVYAVIDLCKLGDSLLQNLPKEGLTEAYVFMGYGEKEGKYTEDQYGDKLLAYDAKDVIKALEADWRESKKNYGTTYGYRRLYWALQLLKAMVKASGGETMKVVKFGH